jgi:hypothetical protein
MKKSIIINCAYSSPYQAKNGDIIHYHSLTLQNGDIGNCATKDIFPPKIAVGQEITYEISEGRITLERINTTPILTPTQNTIKPKYMQNLSEEKPIQRKYTKAPEDAITFIMGYASNRHVAKITSTKKEVPLQEMLDEADIIYDHYKKMLNS